MKLFEFLKRRWIGNPAFYRRVMAVALPIMLQSAVTNFVNMLDNIMIGQVGTLQMSGVSIANSLLFIYNITIFGCVNAAGIFSAQYCGKNDMEGVRSCLRLKFLIGLLASAAAALIFTFFGSQLLDLYMNPELNTASQIATAKACSQQYLRLMLAGLLPFALSQCISSTMRDAGETVFPMISSFVAVGLNFAFNYILIFGHFGFPKLGIAGAAIATVISRFAELIFISWCARRNTEKMPFFEHILPLFKVDSRLVGAVVRKGAPLVVNELLWSIGIAGIAQCYSRRGLDAIAAYNIYSTVNNLFLVVCIGMGSAIGIVVGQLLGAGKTEEARITDIRMIVFSIFLCILIGGVLILSASLFPMLYNTSDTVRHTAASLLRISGLMMPVGALCNGAYFTMRSGGRTIITFLSDSAYTCLVSWPLAFCLCRFTSLSIVIVVLLVSSADILKGIFGLILVEKGVWINNLVTD